MNRSDWYKWCVYDDDKIQVRDLNTLPTKLEKLVGNYYRTENLDEANLQRAIASTVRIAKGPEEKGATGFVVVCDERKYLLTAAHVVPNTMWGSNGLEKVFERNNGGILQRELESMRLVYTSYAEYPSIRDMAIFEYDGDLEGIPIQNDFENPQVGFALGFPLGYFDKDSGPLLSVGLCANYRISHDEAEPNFETDAKSCAMFSGRVRSGNSGGPLVNQNGEVIGLATHAMPLIYGNKPLYARFEIVSKALNKIDMTPAGKI